MANWKLQGTSVIEDTDAPVDEPVEADEGFDPADHTIDDVKAYIEANPSEAEGVLAAEEAGKGRVTLVDWLIAFDGG